MRARAAALPVLLAGAAALATDAATTACGPSVTADLGLSSYMRIPSAQFVSGAMPPGTSSGPQVLSINLVNSDIYPNFPGFPIAGVTAPSATAVAIGLQGDQGYWTVVAGPPGYTTPNDPSFTASATFSAGIVAGKYTLVVQAVDGSGHFGPPSTQTLSASSAPPSQQPPSGQLVVTLTWQGNANLDLHVVDPAGQDLYWGDQSTQPPFSYQQMEGGSYGIIDDDSNANCVIDDLDREDAVWASAPPPGQYVVRVDTASLCGEPDAYWTVRASLHGAAVGQAQGVGVDADTWGSHGPGSGVTAFTFDVP